jgi:uncharacterized protein (DUF305 family)
MVIGTVVSSSCGSNPDHRDHASSTTSATEQVAAHSADDIAFANNMITYNRQTLKLVALVSEHSLDPAVIRLASAIASQEQPQTNAMKALLLQWDVDPNEQHNQGARLAPGTVDDATLSKLQSLFGAEFDNLWLQSVLGQHQGAIEMANAEIADGRSDDMISLAKSLAITQQAEIDEIKQMLGR